VAAAVVAAAAAAVALAGEAVAVAVPARAAEEVPGAAQAPAHHRRSS